MVWDTVYAESTSVKHTGTSAHAWYTTHTCSLNFLASGSSAMASSSPSSLRRKGQKRWWLAVEVQYREQAGDSCMHSTTDLCRFLYKLASALAMALLTCTPQRGRRQSGHVKSYLTTGARMNISVFGILYWILKCYCRLWISFYYYVYTLNLPTYKLRSYTKKAMNCC